MACHKALAEATGLKIFFADPRSPWQRASNENSNSLIRQFLPKGAKLNLFQEDDLEMFEWLLNTRPHAMFEDGLPGKLITILSKKRRQRARIGRSTLDLLLETDFPT